MWQPKVAREVMRGWNEVLCNTKVQFERVNFTWWANWNNNNSKKIRTMSTPAGIVSAASHRLRHIVKWNAWNKWGTPNEININYTLISVLIKNLLKVLCFRCYVCFFFFSLVARFGAAATSLPFHSIQPERRFILAALKIKPIENCCSDIAPQNKSIFNWYVGCNCRQCRYRRHALISL